jgi:hypothetical protein
MPKFIVLIAIFLLFSCNSNTVEKPSKLISKAKLTDILTEIHQAEGKINNLGIGSTDTTSFLYRKLQQQILTKYDVDTAAYYQSYKYYLLNTEDFAEICKNVVEKLTKINKLDSIADAKKPKLNLSVPKETIRAGKSINLFNNKHKMDSIRLKITHANK